MADTVTAKLGMTKPEIGASNNTWGTKLNGDLDILDASVVRLTAQWKIFPGDDTPGSAAGPLIITRYGNDTLRIDDPLVINRQTGDATFAGNIIADNISPAGGIYQYQSVAPATPAAGFAAVYFDANGNPVVKRPDGSVAHLGVPPGAICWTGAATADAGWALLNGQAISRTANPALFLRYGTAYGTGDGTTTFNLPDVKGRTIAHVDGGANRLTVDPNGFGIAAVLGAVGGSEGNKITAAAQLIEHAHAVFLKDPGHTHGTNANINNAGGTIPGGGAFGVPTNGGATINPAFTGITIGSVNGVANDNQTAKTGNPIATVTPHPSCMPTIVLNAQIKLG